MAGGLVKTMVEPMLATLTRTIRGDLARLGFAADQRGGNPLRSIDRNANARRTRVMVVVPRLNGAVMTAADRRMVRAMLAEVAP